MLIAKSIEQETWRGITVRIDDSEGLRVFVRIHDRPMIEFSWLNQLANCIRPETWKKVNRLLGEYAVANELISGERLRLDTTAVETNIHWPTDSGLLWDTYRVLARTIDHVRELDSSVVGDDRRLVVKRVKGWHTLIQRRAARKPEETGRRLQRPYKAMIERVQRILAWARDVAAGLETNRDKGKYQLEEEALSELFIEQLRHFADLGVRVVNQAERRVIKGEQVPNEEKIFSIFEPHTELLKRGKAGKPIEFGHMVLLRQVEGCFITDYEAFDKRPVEHELIASAIESHEKMFGEKPSVFTGDKAFYESMARITELERDIDVVAIGKKGGRTVEEIARETDVLFRLAQMFRAGIEGTISFLKRCFRLFRCFNKGFLHYEATVGLTVFSHNLLVLARGSG
jgi:IS5 family transposase